MDTRIELPPRERLDPALHARMLAIAEEALAAGEVLAEEPGFRGMEQVPYKYGHHLPNWFNGFSDGYKREVEATLPISLTFLDNVKGEGLVQAVDLLHRNGVKPWLVFRPYFRPDDGVNPAIVEGYANGAVIRMRDDYFQHPLLKQAYDEGRFIVKLFNETNIGGEGFPRGRAGFADALRYWKQARNVVKAAYPNAKIVSLCNTPGNDDVWFRSDLERAHYWFHGPEAAKPNPTPAEIQAAIESCLFREMFLLCDIIGTHVYANLRSTVTGDLKTWYAYRYKQYLKFLTPYLNAGKKVIINEWDLGYDDGQEYRAEAVVFGLAEIVGPDDAILFVNHWWNGDDNEGAATWEKHQTRKGGQFRPVVNAIKHFRENGTVPNIPPPDPEEPEEPEDPTPTPTPPEREVINKPEWVTFIEPVVPPGAEYWELTRFEFWDEAQSQGKQNIYILDPHDPALKIKVENYGAGQTWEQALDKPAPEWNNVPMWGIGNKYQVSMAGLPGVAVRGMELRGNRHICYLLTFAKRRKQEAPTPPASTLRTLLLAEAERRIAIEFNPNAGLQKVIFAGDLDQFTPNSPEFWITHEGKAYVAQRAENGRGRVRVYYSLAGDWDNVKYVERGAP
jgi:hypothetical protein